MIRYAGIGSRETPRYILEIMKEIAEILEKKGAHLRTGGAKGADTAFENGVMSQNNKSIFLPWKGYNNHPSVLYSHSDEALHNAHNSVKELHPAPHRLSRGAWALHRRNYYILFGNNDFQPVDFVICWTPDGKASGGTGMAIRMANKANIPVYNLFNEEDVQNLDELINSL